MLEIKSLSDIQDLIANQVEENINLDYKAAKALDPDKKSEISKDITAFANADGGTIIYGVKEFDEKEKKHLPESIDPINRKEFSKERLEQIINSSIFPRINNLQIIPIELPDKNNEVVYVVNIPKSDTAHQATDKRYYRRYNFEILSMFDHEIRDVMNRNKFPKIELKFIIEQKTYEQTPSPFALPTLSILEKGQPNKKIIKTSNTLFVYGDNVGQIMANYVNCNLELSADILDPEEYQYEKSYEKYGIELKKIYCDNTVREIKEVVPTISGSYNKYWPARYDPILPGTKSLLKEIILREDLDIDNYNGMIFCSVHADNAEKNIFNIHTAEIKVNK